MSAIADKLADVLRSARLVQQHRNNGADLLVGLCLIRIRELEHLAERQGPDKAEEVRSAARKRIEQAVRKNDSVLEMRDDEFCVILSGLANAQYLHLASSKLERELLQPLVVDDEPMQITPRLGLAIAEASTGSGERLFCDAHEALQRAVATHSCVVIHDTSGDTQPLIELTELSEALAAGEFQLYFQPKVDARYGHVIGAEGLVRWHSRPRGVVRPDQFVPIFETSPLALPFTEFIAKSAIASARKWPDEVSVSINIPPAVLHNNALVSCVHDALQIHGVAAERVVLEVTERGLFANMSAAVKCLKQLRDIGVGVSIDDFGTGESSLAKFRDLPVDEIKIDRSFVAGMSLDPNGSDAAIIKAIVELARAFSLRTVAEGVEDAEARQAVVDIGCDHLQGFMVGAPMPVADFDRWLERQIGYTGATRQA